MPFSTLMKLFRVPLKISLEIFSTLLTSFHLQSIDNLYMVDRELLEVVNPTLEKGAVGFRLPHDKSYDVVIPFRMLGRSYFGNWNNLDKVEMYLRVTSRIKEKLVKVQE